MWKLIELQNLYRKYSNWLKPEALEQSNLVLRLESKWYTYTSIPNSTYTQSIKQKVINKITWLQPWLCDMMIVLKRKSLLFIELKRAKKSLSRVSEAQKEWIEVLNNLENVEAVVAYGVSEAVKIIDQMEAR